MTLFATKRELGKEPQQWITRFFYSPESAEIVKDQNKCRGAVFAIPGEESGLIRLWQYFKNYKSKDVPDAYFGIPTEELTEVNLLAIAEGHKRLQTPHPLNLSKPLLSIWEDKQFMIFVLFYDVPSPQHLEPTDFYLQEFFSGDCPLTWEKESKAEWLAKIPLTFDLAFEYPFPDRLAAAVDFYKTLRNPRALIMPICENNALINVEEYTESIAEYLKTGKPPYDG